MPDELLDGRDDPAAPAQADVEAGTAVDVAVHPLPRTVDEIRDFLPRSLRDRPFPGVFRYLYPPPTGIAPYGYASADARESDGLPGSDVLLARADLDRRGIGRAVLVPPTRGTLPNLDLGSAVCAATNDWLAATWLGESNADRRFVGTIRVNPLDVDAAIAEVERWAEDPRMVQVGVPLEAQLPYGHRAYLRLWEAVAAARLPVAVHSDGVSGASFHPTPGGFPRHHVEFAALYTNNFVYHLTSLIAEGVFERLPSLRFVFTDGGFDMLMPLMWRMDMDWPITRIEAPWVTKRPSRYLRDHVRFVTARFEGPDDPHILAEWAQMSDAAELLVFGSGYPRWSATSPAEVLPGLDAGTRRRILVDNAAELYGVASAAAHA
jgi:predicted TIM-barrel fold metal-dependent hydrolase